MYEIRQLEERAVALADHSFDARAEDVALGILDLLRPLDSMSTARYAKDKFHIPNRNRQPIQLDLAKTPYLPPIMDWMDMPGVRKVGVQGPGRAGKTTSFEVHLTKRLDMGPPVNTLFFMQSKDDLNSYVDERWQWTLDNTQRIADRIDPNDSRNGRTRTMVGDALVQMFPATQKAIRGKAAPLIGADEIDSYSSSVRAGLEDLVDARQLEYGNDALAYFASHPDVGPHEGIHKIINNGLRHLWYFNCSACRGTCSHALEAGEDGNRMHWNISTLMARSEEIGETELLDMIEREARLVCPHCGTLFADDDRLEMSSKGVWLHKGLTLDETGAVLGDRRIGRSMGAIIHAWMSPWSKIGELARRWAAAKLTFDATANDKALREVEVKHLGQVFGSGNAAEVMEAPKVVQARLTAGYDLKTVPRGVVVLTAFVDPQGDRFEVVVIGWSLQMESWLIDRFPLKQWPGFDTIDPGNRLSDWEIIEQAVIQQTYQLQSNPDLYLPIAKVMINAAGQPGVTERSRKWLANMLIRGTMANGHPFESYRVALFVGASSKKGERYGTPKAVLKASEYGDDLPQPVFERALNVHEIKRAIAMRMKIAEPGTPGRMNLPAGLNLRYARELTSERLINGDWIASGRNETWDGWVACDAARELLQLDREEIDWSDPPEWAKPGPKTRVLGSEIARQESYYDRLARLNRGD